jgi:hypothetical protein
MNMNTIEAFLIGLVVGALPCVTIVVGVFLSDRAADFAVATLVEAIHEAARTMDEKKCARPDCATCRADADAKTPV